MSLIPWLRRFKSGKLELILGSASIPRLQVLQQLGIPIKVIPSAFAEDIPKESFAADYTNYPLATSREKTKYILRQLGAVTIPTVLVTCDTICLLNKTKIIEKPENYDHAVSIIRSLAGQDHEVVTGVVISLLLADGSHFKTEFKETSFVRFVDLQDEDIREYVEMGDAMNKAGGYGVQGLGELLVEEIRGSFTNVVGIPLHDFSKRLAELLNANSESILLS